MRTFRKLLPLTLVALAAPLRAAAPEIRLDAPIAAAELREHVKVLAGDDFEGRRAGTEGGRKAAAYLASRFEEIGLAPIGDEGTWFQRFDLPVRTPDPEGCSLTVTGKGNDRRTFPVEEGFLPFSGAADGTLAGAPVAFAGYGIRAPELGWDDYDGVDVSGRIVLVLRHGPRELAGGYRYRGRNRRYISFAAKAMNAAKAGAAALILVNDRAHHPDDEDRLQAAGLPGALPIPFVFAKAEVAEAILSAAGLDFAALQARIDEKARPAPALLGGVTVDLSVATRPVRSENVLGFLPGSDPELRQQVVVIGAHYDHLGTDGMGALDPKAVGQIRNGADDNASGTAAVVELAEHFALAGHRPKRSMLFLAFTGEELGLLGSRHYVAHPVIPLDRTAAMLNLDMVGRSVNGSLFIGGTGTSPVFDPILDRAIEGTGLAVRRGEGGAAPSDNTSFFLKGVPSLFFFTGLHEDYHRATDDWDKLNYEDEARIATLVAAIGRAVADLPEKPAYVRNMGSAAPPGPYLGVQIGGDEAGEGVPLAVVVPETPAAKAGLKAGDRILTVAGVKVASARDLIAALRTRKPGDEVKLLVRRDGRDIELPVILGGR